MADQPYVIRQGDHLLKIASRYGFDADAIWSSEKNADLRKRRQDPNQLVAGDVLYVPDVPKAWHPVTLGQTTAFVAPRRLVQVSVRFMDGGQPLANEPYVVVGADLPPGSTDGDGYVKCTVPVNMTTFRVRFVNRREIHTINVGYLDPANEPSGAAQRLASLGTFGRPAGGVAAPSEEELVAALHAFQVANGLDGTGQLDKTTSDKLVTLHGS